VGLESGFVLRRLHVAGHRSPWVVGPSRVEVSLDRHRCGAASAARAHFRLTPPLRRPSGSARYPRPSTDRSRPLVSGSSPGVPQRSPLHRHHRVRPLSVARGSGLPHPNTFRPCRSSRLRRLPPHTASRVCCTPQPVMGFARFPAGGSARADSQTFPRAFRSPSKLFTIPAGGLSPGSLPPRRWSVEPQSENCRPTLLGLEALFRSRVPHPPCCHGGCIELPWGSLDPGSHRSVLPFWGWHHFG